LLLLHSSLAGSGLTVLRSGLTVLRSGLAVKHRRQPVMSGRLSSVLVVNAVFILGRELLAHTCAHIALDGLSVTISCLTITLVGRTIAHVSGLIFIVDRSHL
jgi:hypothetical protein